MTESATLPLPPSPSYHGGSHVQPQRFADGSSLADVFDGSGFSGRLGRPMAAWVRLDSLLCHFRPGGGFFAKRNPAMRAPTVVKERLGDLVFIVSRRGRQD